MDGHRRSADPARLAQTVQEVLPVFGMLVLMPVIRARGETRPQLFAGFKLGPGFVRPAEMSEDGGMEYIGHNPVSVTFTHFRRFARKLSEYFTQ